MQFRQSFLQYVHLDTEISFNFIDYKFPNTNHPPFFLLQYSRTSNLDTRLRTLINTLENRFIKIQMIPLNRAPVLVFLLFFFQFQTSLLSDKTIKIWLNWKYFAILSSLNVWKERAHNFSSTAQRQEILTAS